MNVRNEIKAQIIRTGMTMQEVVDLLSQASPTGMEGPLQLRSAGAVRFS